MPALTGIVTDGFGRAQYDVCGGVYDLLDTDLCPGTLNLELTASAHLPLPHWTVTHGGIVRRLWAAQIGGMRVWVLHADHLGTTVEVLAEVHLRTVLGVSNGDVVEVELIHASV